MHLESSILENKDNEGAHDRSACRIQVVSLHIGGSSLKIFFFLFTFYQLFKLYCYCFALNSTYRRFKALFLKESDRSMKIAVGLIFADSLKTIFNFSDTVNDSKFGGRFIA